MVSFQSKFAHDIEKMREWRETLGYAVDSYDGYLVQFDRYCGAFFPDADILTWDIALSYLQTKREHCDPEQGSFLCEPPCFLAKGKGFCQDKL